MFGMTAQYNFGFAAIAVTAALAAGCASSEPAAPTAIDPTTTTAAATTAVPTQAETPDAEAAGPGAGDDAETEAAAEDPTAPPEKPLIEEFLWYEEAFAVELHPCDEYGAAVDGICELDGETLCGGLQFSPHNNAGEIEVGMWNIWDPCPDGLTDGTCDIDDGSAAASWSGTAYSAQTGQHVTLTEGLWRIDVCVAQNDRLPGVPGRVYVYMTPLIDGEPAPQRHSPIEFAYTGVLILLNEPEVINGSWSILLGATYAVGPHPGGWGTTVYADGDDITIWTAHSDLGISAGEYGFGAGVDGDWAISVIKIR